MYISSQLVSWKTPLCTKKIPLCQRKSMPGQGKLTMGQKEFCFCTIAIPLSFFQHAKSLASGPFACLHACKFVFGSIYIRAQNFWPPLSSLCFAFHREEVHLCATIMHIANGPLGGNRSKQCLSKASLPHGFWDPWAHYVSSQCLWLFHEGVLWPRANELFLLKNLLDKV